MPPVLTKTTADTSAGQSGRIVQRIQDLGPLLGRDRAGRLPGQIVAGATPRQRLPVDRRAGVDLQRPANLGAGQVSQRRLVPVEGKIYGEWEIGPQEPTGKRTLQVIVEGAEPVRFEYEVK